MAEKELKYMGNTIKCKEMVFPDRKDNYGRPLAVRIGKQSDAEHVTEESGAMRWTAGAFFDIFIGGYVTDEEYSQLTEENFADLAKKLGLI